MGWNINIIFCVNLYLPSILNGTLWCMQGGGVPSWSCCLALCLFYRQTFFNTVHAGSACRPVKGMCGAELCSVFKSPALGPWTSWETMRIFRQALMPHYAAKLKKSGKKSKNWNSRISSCPISLESFDLSLLTSGLHLAFKNIFKPFFWGWKWSIFMIFQKVPNL